MTRTLRRLQSMALISLTSLLIFPGVTFGVPNKIKVESVADLIEISVAGKPVYCGAFKGKTFAGRVTKNGKFFKPTNKNIGRKVKKLKAKRARASGKEASKLQKKIKKLNKKKKREALACGAGNPAKLLKPYAGAVTPEHIRYLTEKAGLGFGAKEQSLLAIRNQGIEAVVSEFMRIKSEPAGFQATYEDWLDGQLDTDQATTSEGIRRAWIYAMIHGNNPFRERLALFLLGLWTAADDVLENNEAYLLSDYINGNPSIPMQGLRGFAKNPQMRSVALELSKSAMMLIYLDGRSNIKGAPNENFARELFELFTTGTADLNGKPNYTEEGDIVKAAAALTGWRVSNGNRGFSPFDQDTGTFVLFQGTGYDCTVSGSGQGKIDQVVNCIFDKHPNVANFYAQELLKEYLTPNPSNELIKALAKVIKDNNYHLDAPLKTLLSSDIFYNELFQNTIAKNSTEFVVEAIRTLGIPLNIASTELWVRKMGMELTTAPSVFWFPESTWSSPPVKLEAINFVSTVIEDNYSAQGWGPENVMPAGTPDPSQIIDFVAAMHGVTFTDDQKAQLLFFMNNRRNNDGSYTEDLFDLDNPTHLRERVLGIHQIALISVPAQMK